MDKCGICLEDKSDPVALRCGHTFCNSCVENYIRIAMGVNCPLCRCPFERNAESQNEQTNSYDAESVTEESQFVDSESEEEVAEERNHPIPSDDGLFFVGMLPEEETEDVTGSVPIHVIDSDPEEMSGNESNGEEYEVSSCDETDGESDYQMDYEDEWEGSSDTQMDYENESEGSSNTNVNYENESEGSSDTHVYYEDESEGYSDCQMDDDIYDSEYPEYPEYPQYQEYSEYPEYPEYSEYSE